MLFCGRQLPVALLFLFWHGTISVLALFNYSFWMRFQNTAIVDSGVQDAYLAFSIIGLAAFAFGAGPMFFFSFKYGATNKARAGKLRLGIVIMYLTSSCPLFLLELYIAYTNLDIVHVLDGMLLILLFMSWGVGSIIVWFVYMWEVSRFLQHHTGANRHVAYLQRQELERTGKIQPHVTVAARPLPGQPAVI